MPTLDELREARNSAIARINNTSAVENAPLMDNLAALGNALAADHALITAQQQRIEALEAALEPFALMGEIFVNSTTIHPSYAGRDREIYSLNNIVLTRSSFEDAYRLLHADAGEKGE